MEPHSARPDGVADFSFLHGIEGMVDALRRVSRSDGRQQFGQKLALYQTEVQTLRC